MPLLKELVSSSRASCEAAISEYLEKCCWEYDVRHPNLQEMAMFEQYIMGMLTNFEAGLPLERIHNILKMFVPDQAYDKTSKQLATFLGQLIADEKLKKVGDIYTKRIA